MRKFLTVLILVMSSLLNAGFIPANQYDLNKSKNNLSHEAYVSSDIHFARGFRIPRPPPPRAPKPPSQPKAPQKEAPKGGHSNNKRESSREKHENADARRQREQQKAEERRDQNRKR